MVVYVCMHCRQELYKEGEEERQCEEHPWTPADKVQLPDPEQLSDELIEDEE
jgi:hypothetical protein